MPTNPRQKIEALEQKIKKAKQELAEARRKVPPTDVKDYTFKNSFGEDIKLSSLFGDKKELILIHNMGIGCPYCTLWADGYNGVIKHLEDRAAFVVESAQDPFTQRQFALDRGWTFRMVSSKGTSFKKDMGYADAKNSPSPGVSVFTKDAKGKIQRVSDSELGPGDNFCVLWDFFDLLPTERSGDAIDYFYSKVR